VHRGAHRGMVLDEHGVETAAGRVQRGAAASGTGSDHQHVTARRFISHVTQTAQGRLINQSVGAVWPYIGI